MDERYQAGLISMTDDRVRGGGRKVWFIWGNGKALGPPIAAEENQIAA